MYVKFVGPEEAQYFPKVSPKSHVPFFGSSLQEKMILNRKARKLYMRLCLNVSKIMALLTGNKLNIRGQLPAEILSDIRYIS